MMNCIHSYNNNTTFHFLSFQLNTTDFSSDSGVKNIVWTEGDNQLYERIEPKRAMLRNTMYHNYDPEVYEKFVAMHLTGIELSYTWKDIEPGQKQRRQTETEDDSMSWREQVASWF